MDLVSPTTSWLALALPRRRFAPVPAAVRCLLAAAALMLAPAVHADMDADPPAPQVITDAYIATYPAVQALLARDDPAAALKEMQAELAKHETDPAYFNLTGLIALRARNFIAAQVAFERVVLMQPENAGAWMDLAIATTESGGYASATSYFDYIEAEFSPPPALRAVIARYRARIASPPLSSYGLRLQAEISLGSDSNANSGLQNSNIPLTIGTDRIELPLDPSSHARADQFVQVAAGGSFRRQLEIGTVELAVNVRQRRYRTEHDFSTLELNLAGGLRKATAYGDLNFGLHASYLTLGGTPLMHTLVALAQIERPISRCRVGLGMETEGRRYFSLTSLDANLLWGQTGVGCNWTVASVPVVTALIARSGLDRPTGNRAGGETRHSELILQASAPVLWGVNADVSYTLAKANDADGYSPLLESNAPRWIDRRSARVTLGKTFGEGAEAVLSFEDNRVTSNLPLFRQSGRIVSFGVRKNF